MADLSSNQGDNPGFQEYSESTLEQRENKAARQRKQQLVAETGSSVQEHPKCLYKDGGLTKIVGGPDEEVDAKSKGWMTAEEFNATRVEEPTDSTSVSGMSIPQAIAFVRGAALKDLAAIEADEQSHGNRQAVVQAIEEAKDAAPGRSIPQPPPPEPTTTPSDARKAAEKPAKDAAKKAAKSDLGLK
ncbi:MAG TPA: hypothetical protein VJ777_07880 [Mycobacterium sp.]|nr:hypothetical protein [Mycobacterium sp.]